jgi:N-acetylglucosamine-6-phosphate deacetylase
MRMTSEKDQPVCLPVPERGSAIVRHYRDGYVFAAEWDATGLLSLVPAPEEDPGHLWIAPGLIELQVNGYGGIDFQRDCSPEDLHTAAAALRRDGCLRTLLTLITCPWDEMLRKVENLRTIIRKDSTLSRAFPGWHIEGPFLSDQKGFSGAHDPRWMRDPRPEDIARLKAVVGDDPVLLTIAPERPGSVEAVAAAVRHGFVVSFGHTNASAAQLRAAHEAGGRAFTHLGNGCTQQLDRHDNIIWRVIDEAGIVAGIIPDTHHVSPPLFRILHRTLGPDRIYWTTDAMAAAGAAEGWYTIGDARLHVGPDRVVRNPETNTFAGSALDPIEGIRRGARMLGRPWQEVWDYFSAHPARLMNLHGELAVGSPAGFCLLQTA